MKKFKNIVILAGGESNRFWPLKDKTMLSFYGKPLIFYQIVRLYIYAENLFIVSSKSNYQEISNLIKEIDEKINVVVQEEEGQAGALLSLKSKLSGETLVVNANDFFEDEPIENLIEAIQKSKSDTYLIGKKMDEYFPGGYLKHDKEIVKEVIEKPAEKNIPSNYVRLAIDYFANIQDFIKVFQQTKTDKDDWYEKGLTEFIKKGKKIEMVPYEGQWYYVKYPWHVLPLTKFFLSILTENQIDETAKISSSAKIIPPVYIGPNVKIGSFVKIVGPCFLGENTIVGDFAMLRESHIGKNSLIGSYAEVTRSYLGDKVMLHRNYVGDSVLDSEVLMGAGSVCANFRFDEKKVKSFIKGEKIDTGLSKLGVIIGANSKIGSGSVTIPGVKIGKNSLIGPGERVDEDIEDNTFFFKGKKTKNQQTK